MNIDLDRWDLFLRRYKLFIDFVSCAFWVLLAILLIALFVASPDAKAETIPHAANAHRATLVRAAHSEFGINAPVATFAAQVHQESRWRSNAESPAGALGIAQFMPATAVWMQEIYPRTLANADPLNPGWALRAMVKYDAWLYQRVQAETHCDRWAMALAAYNGGLGWVYKDKRLALASGASELAWFDSVEKFNAGRSAANFAENRHYPRTILLKWEPLYSRAGWGNGVCGERYTL